MPEKEENKSDRFQFLATILGLSGVIGFILYAFAWGAGDAFYLKFGVYAEEVGADQAFLVGRAAMLAVGSGFLFIVVPAIVLYVIVKGFGSKLFAKLHALNQLELAGLLLVILLAWAFILGQIGTSIGSSAGTKIIDKKSADIPWLLDYMGIYADRVDVVWLSKPPSGYKQGDRLLRLGQHEGVTFIYDLDSKRLFRIPTEVVELTIH